MNSVVLKTVLAVGGLSWLGILLVSGTIHVDQTVHAGGVVHEAKALWAPFGGAVTAASVVVWLFESWLWRLWPLSRFVKRPDLRGT